MPKKVHFIPVGFDFERLLLPISRGQLDADLVYLLRSPENSSDEAAKDLSSKMIEKLKESFDHIGIQVREKTIDDIYDYNTVYQRAYNIIKKQIDERNQVFVNISSMPRTVAFAFATATNSIIVEKPKLRDSIHTYYVSPKEYLITKMIDELKEEQAFLNNLLENGDNSKIPERLQKISVLIEEIDKKGTTKGAKEINGSLYVEFPTPPVSKLRHFERELLYGLYELEKADSISKLAKNIAEKRDFEYDESYRSKVQYNAKSLEEKGFVVRRKKGKRHEIKLSKMGRLWVQTHP